MDVPEVEQSLRALSGALTAVEPAKCLCCYLVRMLEQFGCDGGHRFTKHWRDAQPQSMPGLTRRLESRGSFCDCEVVFNVFLSGRPPARDQTLQCRVSYEEMLSADDGTD
ncbi:MAG TPA: DUF2695 domain-containing protein [Actinomycetes bacterium]